LEPVRSDGADGDDEEVGVSVDEGVEDPGIPEMADEDRASVVHARETGSISDPDADPSIKSVRGSDGATLGSAPLVSFCPKLDAVRKYGSFDIVPSPICIEFKPVTSTAEEELGTTLVGLELTMH